MRHTTFLYFCPWGLSKAHVTLSQAEDMFRLNAWNYTSQTERFGLQCTRLWRQLQALCKVRCHEAVSCTAGSPLLAVASRGIHDKCAL